MDSEDAFAGRAPYIPLDSHNGSRYFEEQQHRRAQQQQIRSVPLKVLTCQLQQHVFKQDALISDLVKTLKDLHQKERNDARTVKDHEKKRKKPKRAKSPRERSRSRSRHSRRRSRSSSRRRRRKRGRSRGHSPTRKRHDSYERALFLASMRPETTWSEAHAALQRYTPYYGGIVKLYLSRENINMPCRSYGFVLFSNPSERYACLRNREKIWDESHISVRTFDFAKLPLDVRNQLSHNN